MGELTQADRYLLEKIRQGCADAWAQLVGRHQGRLLAFARSRLPGAADAEDVVQETFVSLLKSLGTFRDDASLETYLFAILRNKIADWFRGRRLNVCRLQDVLADSADGRSSHDGLEQLPSSDPSTSWYVRQAELGHMQREALTGAMRELIDGFKNSQNFRDLQVVEMLFYCQLRNADVAQVAGIADNHVALIKHRCLKQIRQYVARKLPAGDSSADSLAGPARHWPNEADVMLSRIWQEQRLSCLKRSTIGAYLLGTLAQPWHDYVAFHLDKLGCHFCRANLSDLQREQSGSQPRALRDRILESTVGFLSRP